MLNNHRLDEATATPAPNVLGSSMAIVAAYVSKNPVSAADLPKLIADVHSAVMALGSATATAAQEEARAPAVPVKKSISPDHLVCLEDGKKFKSLKRHLRVHYRLTPEQYREKWKLPSDYPMVAPNYSEKRSQLAKSNGLGRKQDPAAILANAH